nr:MAG TPA: MITORIBOSOMAL PROTEIN US2M, MRPS2, MITORIBOSOMAL, TRANSLATION, MITOCHONDRIA, MAMMALIAN 55S [Caudoviricetes sp.]
MFTQADIDKMLKYLRRYDKTISEAAFFNEL